MFQQIIRVASDSSGKQLNILDQVATNVSNINTVGYKARRFDTYLMPDGRLEGANREDYSQGPIMVTRRELDVAIKGEGFIPVTETTGRVVYTRDGSFTKNAEGFLVTNRGDLVGDGIQVPANAEKVQILPNGTVQALIKGKSGVEKLGQLSLARFANPEGLKALGYNKLLATVESGPAEQVTPSNEFKQGAVERSNVSVFHQVDQILRLNAGVISNLRVIKFSDELYRQAINLKQ